MRKYEEDRVDLIVRLVVGAICFCLLAMVIVLLPRVMNSGKKAEAMTTTQEESSEPTEKASLPAVSLETISSETKVVVSVKPLEPIPTPTTAPTPTVTPTPVPKTPTPVIVPETTPAPTWPDQQAQPAIDPATRPEDLTPPKPVPPEPKLTVSDGRF